MSAIPTIQTEVMLLDWSETAKGGAKIVLQLPSRDDLEPFKALTLAKRGIAGQRFMAVFAEVNDQEEPVEAAHRKLGHLALLAVQWCRYPKFQEWVAWRCGTDDERASEEQCRLFILDMCKVAHRRELDTVPSAAEVFHREFRLPFMAHLEGES